MAPHGSRIRVALLVLEGSVLLRHRDGRHRLRAARGRAPPAPSSATTSTLATAAPGPGDDVHRAARPRRRSGLEALDAADLVIVGGCTPATIAGQARGARRARAPRTPAARGSCRSARARSCSPTPACSTAAARRRTGATPTASRDEFPAIDVDPDVLYVDDGDVLTSAGLSRRDGPLPARRARRPRRRRGDRDRALERRRRRTATAARRSTSTARSPTATAAASPRRAPGPSSACTSR